MSDLPLRPRRRSSARNLAFVVAPHEENGGGMGRVKDYIVNSPAEIWRGLRLEPLITRDPHGKFWSLVLVFQACCRIAAAHWGKRLRLVHVNFGDRGSAVRKGILVLFCRLLGVPVFLHFHAVTFERDLLRLPKWLRGVALAPFRQATCVIVLGERWRRWMVDSVGVEPGAVEVLVNGVPIDPPPRRLHVADGGAVAQGGGVAQGGAVALAGAAEPGAILHRSAPTDVPRPLEILFLGNLIERKGISDAIAALATLVQSAPTWRVTFAGNGDVEHYRALADRSGIGARATFTGWVLQAAARDLVASADLLILPSYDEGLPLVILEAVGLGTPVITTPVGATPEVLTDGVDIVFCEAGDRPALAAAIGRLLADAPLRQALADQGIASFRRLFSVDAFRRNLMDIWQRHLPPLV